MQTKHLLVRVQIDFELDAVNDIPPVPHRRSWNHRMPSPWKHTQSQTD